VVSVLAFGAAPLAGAGATVTRAAARWAEVPAAPAVTAREAGLSSITCFSATSCIAVGAQDGVTASPLVETWDGAHWSKNATPDLGEGFSSGLAGVACAQATTCFAVGNTSPASGGSQARSMPLIERWNGAMWSVESVPAPPVGANRAGLMSVSCGSATSCTAVGSYDTSTDFGRLIEHWNGSSWSSQSSPSPSPVHESQFASVACASATTCTAVGTTFGTGSKMGEVIEQWDGAQWSITSAFKYPGWGLNAVSCADTWHCLATGESLALRGEGTVWSDVSPASNQAADMRAVSCTAPLDCVAVAESSGANNAMRWNGSSWQLQTLPPDSKSENMYGLTCLAAGSCLAAGYVGAAPRAEVLHGSAWSDLSVADPVGPTAASVAGVSCVTGSDCVAVGWSQGAPGTVQYIADWNGGSWSLDKHPLRIPRWTQLQSVSCSNSQSCVAVGTQLAGNLDNKVAVAMVLQGGRWYPFRFSNLYLLTGVSCTKPTHCVAVGDADDGTAVAVQWNGSDWSTPQTVLSPTDDRSPVSLTSIACPDDSDCTAVGDQWQLGVGKPAIAQLREGKWTSQSFGSFESPYTTFNAVACSSATQCVAVGGGRYDAGPSALVAASNGVGWEVTTAPIPQGATLIDLTGVSCTHADQCWATGWTGTETTQQAALEHWDGTQWTYVSGPRPPAGDAGNELGGVSCVAAGQCVAVGEDTPASVSVSNGGSPLAFVYR
jgi:hypothetical protein